jgi:hypothetical protein
MRIITMLAVAAMAAACHSRVETDPSTGRVDVDARTDKKAGEEWTSDLRGSGEYGGVTGRATGREMSGNLTVTASLNGLSSGGNHPWHVHEGKCGSGGGIVGPPSAYPPLRPGSSGQASATASLNVDLNEARDYHVNVHLSPTQMGTIIACGDFDD